MARWERSGVRFDFKAQGMKWRGWLLGQGLSGRCWRWSVPVISVAVLLGAALTDHWVERRQGQNDRREVEVHLTASGERMAAKMAALHRDEHLNPAGSFLLPELKDLQEN